MRNLISRGHNVGGGLISPDGNYFFLSIPKNASVFISSVLRQNDWRYSDLSVYTGHNVFCIVRDPVERWISGMATYISANLLGENYVDPVFVKPNEVSLFPTETKAEIAPEPEIEQPKPAASLNSAFAKTIEIGLNDRIAFVNHLFGESNEDFNRVISQLNTFDTLEEAKTFLNEMVIPDYNYWVGKEDYMERFMAVVERKFS